MKQIGYCVKYKLLFDDCLSIFSFSVFPGAGHFEFSSEKNWGVEQDDCKIFDSIDLTHLADSVASVPFNERYCIPVDLYTVRLQNISKMY